MYMFFANRADSEQVFKYSLSKMSSHQNQPAYKATSLLNYYEYSKIKKAEQIVAKTKTNKRKKIVANAFYADKLHSASEQVTTAKKPKIAETVTSGTICNYYATEKNSDIAPAVTAASEYAQVATAATHKIAATEASASESNFEISIIEVAEENSISDGDSEIENCVNVNCKTKVLL